MLKSLAVILLAVSFGMGGAVALTLSHGMKHEQHASLPAPMPHQPLAAQNLPETPVILGLQPDLPRLRPRPRPVVPDLLAQPVPARNPDGAPRLSISSHSAMGPLWAPPVLSGPQPPLRQSLRHADGSINYNPWKTGVYR